MGLPGVKVGPLDPDRTSQFGQVSGRTSARQLIRLHTQAHPPVLMQALSKKLDAERTKAVQENMPEVADYLAGLTHENGDPLVPKGAEVVGASVGGDRDRDQVLRFTYRLKSGRTAKWFTPYEADALPEAHQLGSDYIRRQEMKDRGVVSFDSEANETDRLRKEAARLRRQNEALRARVEGRETVETGAEERERDLPDEVPGDTRADNVIVAENEELRRRLAELEERYGAGGEADAEPDGVPDAGSAAADEPFEGYDELKADEVVKRLHDSDTSQAEREAILEYERSHASRKTVVGAAEQTLGTG